MLRKGIAIRASPAPSGENCVTRVFLGPHGRISCSPPGRQCMLAVRRQRGVVPAPVPCCGTLSARLTPAADLSVLLQKRLVGPGLPAFHADPPVYWFHCHRTSAPRDTASAAAATSRPQSARVSAPSTRTSVSPRPKRRISPGDGPLCAAICLCMPPPDSEEGARHGTGPR